MQASLCVGVVHAHGYPCLGPDVFYVGVSPFANSPHTIRGLSIYMLASTCKCVWHFLFTLLFPSICFECCKHNACCVFVCGACPQSHNFAFQAASGMTEWAGFRIIGLKIKDDSNSDYYLDYKKKKHLYPISNDINKIKYIYINKIFGYKCTFLMIP